MKNKKKILSLIACLSLLSSCNLDRNGNRYCPIDSTPDISTPIPEPEPEPEIVDPFDYQITSNSSNGNVVLMGFNPLLTSEMKLKIEEITIPEYINELYNTQDGLFRGFDNLKVIKIPSNVNTIDIIETSASSYNYGQIHPFQYLPSLENIEIESDYYYTEGNCLIRRDFTQDSKGNRTLTGKLSLICGWGDVVIPEEITNLTTVPRLYANQSITTIKLHSKLTYLGGTGNIRDMPKLKNIDLNGNTRFKIDEGSNVLYYDTSIYAAWGDIKIPSSITTVNLDYCSSVTSIELGNQVTTINAIRGAKIKTLHIPSSVTSVTSYAFRQLENLESITLDENQTYLSVKGNCLYLTENKKILSGWGDVVIPDEIDNLDYDSGYGFYTCYSIKSIKLGKNINSISYENNYFRYINRNRELKDYFKFIDNEENQKFRIKSNCLVSIEGNEETVIFALPDSEGNIVLPSSATDFNAVLSDLEPTHIKSIKFNEGLKSISYSGNLFSNDFKNITEIVLPSTIETISYAYNIFRRLTNLEKLSINGENKYYKVEGNCLIKKGKTESGLDNPSSDEVVFGFGDVRVPERITELTNDTFYYNNSIKSITLHNKIKNISRLSFYYLNLSYLANFKTFNFLGTLEEFKANLDNTTYSIFSRLQTDFKNENVLVSYLDENGNKVSKLLSEIE